MKLYRTAKGAVIESLSSDSRRERNGQMPTELEIEH